MKKFKKFITCGILTCLVCATAFSTFAAAENIIINNKKYTIPADMGEIIEKDERTFVPLRFVTEALNCNVTYDDSSRYAVIADMTATYMIQADSDKLFKISDGVNQSKGYRMDTKTFIKEYENGGRMYIPIRFLAEAMDYTVGWDEESQTVSMTKNSNELAN
ncbi:MAG: copper amine oxidase N-terminal domain-containing protein [Oscillospiraceae bacterium]